MKRKILIISHNPISNRDNMGVTLQNIFKGFSKDELCQLYLRNQEPNYSVCEQYFYIDEMQVVKSILRKNIETGKIVSENLSEPEQVVENAGIKSKIYNFGRRRTQSIYMVRNFLWNRGHWFSDELKTWLKKQNPTCIFFSAGDYTFSMDMAIEIANYLEIPLFSYYVDEYYFYKVKKQRCPIEALRYQKKFRILFNISKMNFCISEMMQKVYEQEFGKKTEVLMNAGNLGEMSDVLSDKNDIKMYYMGNISYDRWKNLSTLSSEVTRLNQKESFKINFEIYSGEKDSVTLNNLTSNEDVNFCGEITSEEVSAKIKEADILVHTEAFDKKNIDGVKYSVSTKISALLGSGKIILAYGPEEVECINYLKRNKAALVVSKPDELEASIKEVVEGEHFKEIIDNAISLFKRNHTQEKNKIVLDKYLV